MLILSHRGYHVNIPENTLNAFHEAIHMGVDGIETDIRISADNSIILRHDRLAPDGREVSLLSRSELSEQVGHEIPTLESALQKWPDLLWNLEIKTPSALEATIRVVTRFRQSTRFLITSFWHKAIKEFSQQLDVDCGILIGHCPPDFQTQLEWILDYPMIKTIVWNFEFIEEDMLNQVASHGIQNFVYGVKTIEDHKRCNNLEINGIITDRPEFLGLS